MGNGLDANTRVTRAPDSMRGNYSTLARSTVYCMAMLEYSNHGEGVRYRVTVVVNAWIYQLSPPTGSYLSEANASKLYS